MRKELVELWDGPMPSLNDKDREIEVWAISFIFGVTGAQGQGALAEQIKIRKLAINLFLVQIPDQKSAVTTCNMVF